MSSLFRISTLCLLLLPMFLAAAGGSPDLLPADQVRRGMRGYGLTVFQGTTIEKFQVEILGVLYKTGAGSDLILARLSGGPLKQTGMIAGMSGSPVYVNGKLIGAVAYAWGFAKSTIAGITPIKEMLRIFRYDRSHTLPPFKMQGPGRTLLNDRQLGYRGSHFRPVATPLVFSGINPSLFSLLEERYSKMGFLPLLGGEAGKAINARAGTRLQPGSAVGVQLVGGDISMTGVGTVTWVGKQGILAFGHPMMQRGPCSFPMTTAWVHTLMPSLQLSFKMSSPLSVVGAIDQDRRTGIAGRLGKRAATIPVRLQLASSKGKAAFNFTVIRDELLFANLFGTVVLNTLINHSALYGRASYRIRYAFTLRDQKNGKRYPVRIKDTYATFMNAKGYLNSLVKLLGNLNQVLFNPYRPVRLEGIEVAVEAVPRIQAIEITDLRCDKKKVQPGETVTLRLQLRPFQGKPFWRKLSLTVPRNAQNGKIFFVASSALHERFFDRFFASGRYQPANLEQTVRLLNMNHNSGDLVIWSELAQKGLIVDGTEYPNLPDSMYKLLASSPATPIGKINARLRRIFPTNYFIYGLKLVLLEVDHSRYD